MCVSIVSLLVDPLDQGNQEMRADRVRSREGDTKTSAHVALGSNKKVVKVAAARKNYTRDEYSFLKSDSSPSVDNPNLSSRLKKQVAEKPKKLGNEKLERPTKLVNGKLEGPKKRLNENPQKLKKQVEENLVSIKKQVDEISEKPKKYVDEKPEKSKKHVVVVPEKPEKEVDAKPGKAAKHVDDKPGKPKTIVNEKLERSTKHSNGKLEKPKQNEDVMPEKTVKQVDEKAGKFKKDVDGMPAKPVKQVHEKAEKPEKAGKSKKYVDKTSENPETHVDEKSEMKGIKDIDGQSTLRDNHASILESDSSMRSQDSSNSAKHKRKMPADAISDGDNYQLLKESKKARSNQGDTCIHEHDNGTRLSTDARELDVSTTVDMRTEEYPLADMVKDVKKKKKIYEKDGTYSNTQDLCAPILSHRDKLRQLLRGQLRQKVGNKRKDMMVESGNVPVDNKFKTSTIEPEDVIPSKRKLTKKGPHKTASEEVDYKSMNEPCNFVTMEGSGDVPHAKKRLKRLKRLNEDEDIEGIEKWGLAKRLKRLNEDKDMVGFEKWGLVSAEEITYDSFGDETGRDNESGVRSYSTSSDCIYIDVDINNPLPQHVKEEVTGGSIDFQSLAETGPVSLLVGCTPKFLNHEQEGAVERATHSKDGHSAVVKKAMVKRYIPLSTKKQETSDAPVSHEEAVLHVQGRVRPYSREELQEVAAGPEDTHIFDTFDPDSLSASKEQEPTANDQEREILTITKEQTGTSMTKCDVAQRESNHESTCFGYPGSGRKASARTKKVRFEKNGKILLGGRRIESVTLNKSSWSATKDLEAVPRLKLVKAKPFAENKSGSHGLAKPEMNTWNSGKLARSDIGLIVPTSVGCARCSITGWEWRTWARDRAKRRLQRRVKTAIRKDVKKLRRATKKKETNVSNCVTTAVIAGLQAARKNRADMRKLAVAADGSDLLRFNMLKVSLKLQPTNLVEST